jgi:N,N'-diacetyllegionaminate synthase
MVTASSLAAIARSGKVFVVAEIAQAHDGSLGILHSLIDASGQAGVDAVKFQVHIAEAESSDVEPFRTKFSYVDKTRYDYWQRMGFSADQWREIKAHCDSAGVEFLATPFSITAVEMLESLGMTRYKVGSGDIGNELLLRRISATGKDVILSTGLATLDEIGAAVKRIGANKTALLQCTTKYPTAAEDVGLDAIAMLRETFGCIAGLSDHSGTIWPGIAAAALGASIFEAHVTFDRRMFGPDSKASLTIDEFQSLVSGIRFVEKARSGAAGKPLDAGITTLRTIFGRSLAVRRDLPAGHVLTIDDLESKKPAGHGVDMSELDSILGKRTRRALSQWEFLNKADLL